MPGDRFITFPSVDPIVVTDPLKDDGEPIEVKTIYPDRVEVRKLPPITYLEFWTRLLNHPKFSKPFSNIQSALCLFKAIRRAKEAGEAVARVNDDDWKKAKEVADESPDVLGLNAIHNWQLMPFWDSILNATTEDPRKKEEDSQKGS